MRRFGTVLNPSMIDAIGITGGAGDARYVNNGSIGVDFVDGQINIHGQLVGGAPQPTGPLDQISMWVRENQGLAIGLAVVGGYLVLRK